MNGIKPIKETFMTYLAACIWQKEYSDNVGSITRSGPIDT
ncbi:hypothetical protein GGC02_00560 [Bacillus velezensis]|nr:hypothetical protein [Bacillus velezensis]MEE1862977.1 hypothetical protein [Bacillus velezensis]NME90645.1 hypothetical protein [Bacillus velezensis]QCC37995.1 hypothetical protein E4T61_19120 [Bacillus velezensis]QXW55122.1 hypothetical protein KXY09_02755 [Bacillus velezensis]